VLLPVKLQPAGQSDARKEEVYLAKLSELIPLIENKELSKTTLRDSVDLTPFHGRFWT
jgi:hypothetical protein